MRPLRAYLSSPDDCDVNHGMMVSTRANPISSIRTLWQSPVLTGGPVSRDIYGASRRTDGGIENLVYLFTWDFKGSFNMP
jgi:hypothetical protein